MSLADYIENKPTIHTTRLCIRPMSAKDIPALKEWMPDKSIYTYWGKGLIRQGKMVNTWCDYYLYGILFSDMD